MRAYCLAKPGAWADQPWEGDYVAKVGPPESGKIFAFLGEATVGVKCAPTREEADEWLVRYPDHVAVMPYIGRNGWNVLGLDGPIPDEELLEAVDTSYDMVVAKLPKRDRPVGSAPRR